MDMKLGHKYPSPSLLRLYITKAILEITEEEIAESKNTDDIPTYTFGTKAISVINKAVTKACDDWEKDGIFAGILDHKVEKKLKEIEDA